MKEEKLDAPAPSGNEQSKSGISRRGFLRGASLTTAGTVLVNSGLLAGGTGLVFTEKGQNVGPDAVTIDLKINGTLRTVSAEPRATLAQVLRDHLQLTGTKVVCDRGSCSACTVWLDGTPVNSCMTLAIEAQGHEITTIEGLAKGDALHPLQEAFIEHDASQCGFCTPGMIMSSKALLDKNPNPTREEVVEGIVGNVCRCTGFTKIIESILVAAESMR
jgi:aerobic-type carbon monoxide dehydrogenase small subunit (CoxS/CutS family)